MDFKKFTQQYAQEIGGQFREYDDSRSVIIVPLHDGRFQTVVGNLLTNVSCNREVVQIKTKVCGLKEDIPFKDILKAGADFLYARFIVEEAHLKVAATNGVQHLCEEIIKDMIQEVANVADDWECKITGKDLN